MEMVSGNFIVQSPTTIAPDHTLPSPLLHGQHGSFSRDVDMSIAATENRRRRSSKSGPITGVKRAASSPNVRALGSISDSAATLAEKRRNKLGYHRTSVACVHCRRRKIRCLIANEDPTNRCSNCIRLKKECNFFPVDQQPALEEERPRANSKSDVRPGNASASSSSSPKVGSGHAGERSESFSHNYRQPLPSSHAYSAPLLPLNTSISLSSPPNSAALSSARFDVQEGSHSVGWNPTFFDGHHLPTGHAGTDEHSNGYWKIPEPPHTPAFSPYSTVPPTSFTHGGTYPPPPGYPGASSRSDSSWQSMRSMSYSQVDDAASHRQDSYSTPYHSEFRRSTVDMLPSLHSGTTSSNASMAEAPNGSISGPSTSQPMMHFGGGLHQSWSSGGLPTQSPKTTEFGGWYADPGQLSKVQEEDVAHYPEPPAMYSSSHPPLR